MVIHILTVMGTSAVRAHWQRESGRARAARDALRPANPRSPISGSCCCPAAGSEIPTHDDVVETLDYVVKTNEEGSVADYVESKFEIDASVAIASRQPATRASRRTSTSSPRPASRRASTSSPGLRPASRRTSTMGAGPSGIRRSKAEEFRRLGGEGAVEWRRHGENVPRRQRRGESVGSALSDEYAPHDPAEYALCLLRVLRLAFGAGATENVPRRQRTRRRRHGGERAEAPEDGERGVRAGPTSAPGRPTSGVRATRTRRGRRRHGRERAEAPDKQARRRHREKVAVAQTEGHGPSPREGGGCPDGTCTAPAPGEGGGRPGKRVQSRHHREKVSAPR